MRTTPGSIILTLISTIFGTLGTMLFKIGSEMNLGATSDIILNQNIWTTLNSLMIDPVLRLPTLVFLGFVFYGLGAITLVLAMRKGELSVVYPVYAANYVWVAILSWLVLGEVIEIINWLGVGVIILGVSLIGYGSTILGEDTKPVIERLGIPEEVEE
jgi:uncharacterized membrane protein